MKNFKIGDEVIFTYGNNKLQQVYWQVYLPDLSKRYLHKCRVTKVLNNYSYTVMFEDNHTEDVGSEFLYLLRFNCPEYLKQ